MFDVRGSAPLFAPRARKVVRKGLVLGSLVSTCPSIAQAPLAIVVGMEHSPYAVSDASRAVQSMVLTARAQGILTRKNRRVWR